MGTVASYGVKVIAKKEANGAGVMAGTCLSRVIPCAGLCVGKKPGVRGVSKH